MGGLAWSLQRRLIYFPSPLPPPPAAAFLPRGEDVEFETEDGLRLRGWFAPAPGAPRASLLVCNGNAGDRSGRAPLAATLAAAGVSVLLFDYRGYAGNPGEPAEAGLAADARAARAYLLSRPEVSRDSLVYLGESLGAAVAIGLTTRFPPAALVLRSPFTSLADVGRVHYPFLPVERLLRDRYDALAVAPEIHCPVLVVAGGADTIVPAEQSRRLHDALGGPKRYVEISGADHNDWELLAGEEFVREILAFLPSATR